MRCHGSIVANWGDVVMPLHTLQLGRVRSRQSRMRRAGLPPVEYFVGGVLGALAALLVIRWLA